jgi:hypothetical protein
MRALGAIIGGTFGLGGIAVAGAADLPRAPAGDFSPHYSVHGRRAGMLVIYDNQPGVVVRRYWRAPWRHRHYFPATGEQPAIGRDEDLSARSDPQPAESYQRFWSTSSAFLPELPRGRVRDTDTEPSPTPLEPSLK